MSSVQTPTGPLVDIHTLELLASRICHDLISPVSAMNNGLEFVAEGGPAAMKDAMDLLGYSAATASAKLQVLRMVYGAGGADPNIRLSDIRAMFDALVAPEGKVRIEWDESSVPQPSSQGSGYAKILASALLLAVDSLPRGGTVKISGADSGALILAEGTGASLREGVEEALKGAFAPPVLDPKTVHPYIAALFCAQYGFEIAVQENAGGHVALAIKSRNG